MADPRAAFVNARRSNWVRLRTLVVLRWIAIAGQVTAITTAQMLLDLRLDLGLIFLAIGAAVSANLIAIFVYPESKRLSESEVAAMLLFDISHLAFLLFLTGGLHNPFALLMLVPVTISATALRPKTTAALGIVAILLITAIAVWYRPLSTVDGDILRVPNDLRLGFWVSIVIGVVFLAGFAQRVTSEIYAMSEALVATQMALAREQKLTDLGGVVAAAAHELGTPLATIKLVSSELAEELGERKELKDDLKLLSEQADRCRDILRSMGRAGKDDLHLRNAPIEAVVREAAEPHMGRGKHIFFDVGFVGDSETRQPVILRRPEIIHGLRNLIQNAVDFAESTVCIDVNWTEDDALVRIADDGRGFSASVLNRIGDPFVRNRRETRSGTTRPGYEGMGLGLFIAKTLLERSSAELSFANGAQDVMDVDERIGSGAVVQVRWPLDAVISEQNERETPLGENVLIKT